MQDRLFAGDSRYTEKGRKKTERKRRRKKKIKRKEGRTHVWSPRRSSARICSIRRDTRDITYHEMHVRLVDHFESVDASAAVSPTIQLETYAAICSLNCVCSSNRESLQLSNCCCCCCCCNGGGGIVGTC